MAYEMRLMLTEQEYAALSTEAAKIGKRPEMLLHDIMAQHIQSSKPGRYSPDRKEIQDYLYQEGLIEHVPTDEPETLAEATERDHLAHLFGQGKPVSEMVIEDRGPH